jgi:hypothetical protein
MKQYYIKGLKVCCLFLLFIFILFFGARNFILHAVIQKKIATISEKFNTQIEIKSADFKGISGLLVQGITVAPSNSDTLIRIDSVFLKVRIWPLLRGKIRFSNLTIQNVAVHLVKQKGYSNFTKFLKRKSPEAVDTNALKKTNYKEIAEKLFVTLFDILPAELLCTNTKIKIESDSLSLQIHVPKLAISENKFATRIDFIENAQTLSWIAEGTILSDLRKSKLKIYPYNSSNTQFPILKQKWKLQLGFDTLKMNLEGVNFTDDEVHFYGDISLLMLRLNHWRISPNNVIINKQRLNFECKIGANYFMLDSSSSITYNKVTYQPFAKFQVYPSRQLQLDAKMAECNAQDFFESFPIGLFENIEQLKVSGTVNYRLHFFIDTKHPDDLEFSSYLAKNKFKILDFGKCPLVKLNGEFMYTAYEKGKPMRSFMVGSSNPNYTPILSVAELLKSAVLTSEDGNFYSHSGFNEDAFKHAISANFKEGRFARGGSTISMQLVKNVFLTRNKTVARKVEEALLVWLIENNRITSKERMYEVYLNIIEWGPNIYGIGEASKFYFAKSPSELSLAESIFLAMIVPRPKAFKYNFDVDGKLRESVASYYSLVAAHMLKRGIINEEQIANLVPSIELKGAAKLQVLVKDSLVNDTIPEEFILGD